MTVREICPKDFYWFALMENDFSHLSQTAESIFCLLQITDAAEEDLERLPASAIAPLINWATTAIFEGSVMKVEQWLELAFHLQKQRWDSSIDWLETQPISKILLMNRIQGKFVEEQNREMKRNSRKR